MKYLMMTLSLVFFAVANTQAQSETLRVWLDSKITLTADSSSVAYLKLYENDGNQAYTSFNMSLVVPKGIHVHKVKQGRNMVDDLFLSERATTTHTIACNMPSDTLLKVACTSSMNQDLYTDDEDGNLLDELWTIGLVADPTMVNGDYVVTMPAKGLIFNMKQGDTYVSSRIKEDVKCIFTIVGGAITSVKKCETDGSPDVFYDLGGRKLDKPLGRGVYIVNGKKEVR